MKNMKIKFKVARGRAVISFESKKATLREALDLLQREEVISISVTKQTPSQYLKTVPTFNETKQDRKDENGGVLHNGEINGMDRRVLDCKNKTTER